MTGRASERTPLLLLILGSPPPVPVAGGGALSIHDAITRFLPGVHQFAVDHPLILDDLGARIADVCAWTTWHDLAATVTAQHRELAISDPSIAATITRLTKAVISSVAHHA